MQPSPPEQLVAEEWSYEELGALAYRRQESWSLVKTKEGVTGWLAPAHAGEFHSLERLLERGLVYLTEEWDGLVSSSPGGADRRRVDDDPLRRVVGYIQPVLSRITVAGKPGQTADDIARQYRSLSVGSRPGPNGTRIFGVEVGVVLPYFDRPSVLAPIAGQLATDRADETFASDSSPPNVLVFATEPGWYQVALDNFGDWRRARRVWLQASPLWRFFPAKDDAAVRELVQRTYGPEERSVNVGGFQTVDGVLWAHIELLTESVCSAPPGQDPVVRVRGWVPVHAPSGEPNLWFPSRGC